MSPGDPPREEAHHHHEDVTEEHSFDELAKGLASGIVSRRQALKLVGGALLGGLLVSIPGVAQAHHKPGHGTPPGQGGTPPGQGGTPPGQVACPPGLTLCAGLCYDLQTDNCNCGACGNICAGSGLGRCCENGICTTGGLSDCPLPPDPDYCQVGVPPS
jgi:hypothetical protein